MFNDEDFIVNEDPPTSKELEDVIKSFKNGKSGGTDNINSEVLKNNTSLFAFLYILITVIWTTLKVPTLG